MERVKWQRGVERWNHKAEGIRKTGYIILLFFSERVKR